MGTTRAHCNNCLGERNHEILYCCEHDWFDEEAMFGGKDFYELLKCLGCERITLRNKSVCDLDRDINGDIEPTITYFPPAISRPKPHWFSDLYSIKDFEYCRDLLSEIYVGLQNDSVRLATMGIRALLENIMILKVGDKGGFKKNLHSFHSKGYISQNQSGILSEVLEVGHASMHRAYSPSKQDLVTCMDIVETIIETIFIHPAKAQEIASKVPRRK